MNETTITRIYRGMILALLAGMLIYQSRQLNELESISYSQNAISGRVEYIYQTLEKGTVEVTIAR